MSSPANSPAHEQPPTGLERSSGHDMAWYSISRLLAAGFSSMTTIVIAAALDKSSYGVYATLAALAGFATVAADFGLTSSTASFIARGKADRTTVRRVMRLKAVTGSFIVGLFIAGAILAGMLSGSHLLSTLAPFAGLLIIGQTLTAVGFGLLPSLGRFRLLAAVGIGQATTELGLVALLALGHASTSTFMLASFVTGTIAGGIAVAGAIRAPVRGACSGMRPLVRYGAPLFAITISVTAFGVLDPLVIATTRSPAEAAPYVLAFKVIALLGIPALGAAAAVSPRIAGGGPAAARQLQRWTGLVLAGYTVVAMLFGVVAIPALHLLGGRYGGDGWVLSALTGYVLLLGIATLTSTAANYLGGGRKRVPIAFGVLGANIALDLALIPVLGVAGAAISTTLCYTWYTLAHTRLAWKMLAIEVPFARVAGATLTSLGLLAAVVGGSAAIDAAGWSAAVTVPLLAVVTLVGSVAALIVARLGVGTTIGRIRSQDVPIANDAVVELPSTPIEDEPDIRSA